MSTDPLSNQVDPDEISALLKGEETPPVEKEKKVFKFDEKQTQELKEAFNEIPQNKETKETPIETDVAAPFNEQTENLTEFIAWSFKSEKIPDVTVNDLDKNLFFKALLNDSDFTIDIEFNLIEKINVTVRGLTAFEQKIIAGALKEDQDIKEIEGVHSFATYMQQYCMMYQIISINDKPFDKIDVNKNFDLSLKQHVELLRKNMRICVDKLHSQKLSLLTKALITFEIKQKLLHDGLLNKNFWKPQDTV